MKIATRFVHFWLTAIRYNCRRMTHRSLPTTSIHWCTAFAVAAIATVLLKAAPGAVPLMSAQQVNDVAARAMAQIEALIEEKRARTDVQNRIDSQLLDKTRMARGLPLARGIQRLATRTVEAADGSEIVDVTARNASSLAPALTALGARVIFADDRMLRVRTSLDSLEGIAAVPGVIWVHPAELPQIASMINRLARRKAAPSLFWASRSPLGTSAVVDVTSEGDVTHRANLARTNSRVTGAGIKIGVLSSGVDGLDDSKAAGALGNVTVLPGQQGEGNEGTAMLEIIHDLAPGAQLYYATGGPTNSQFATNILNLQAAGCNIIVDDVMFYNESPFQDGQTAGVVSPENAGLIAQAVKDVAAAGVLYFSSAQNSGNLDAGTSGTWEGDYADSGVVFNGNLHRWGFINGGITPQFLNTVSQPGGKVILTWSDPLGHSSNDYDVYLTDSVGNLRSKSDNPQSGTQDPYEKIDIGGSPGDLILVSKFSGSARFLHLDTAGGKTAYNTTGSTHGHADTTAANSLSVAATPVGTKSPNCPNGTSGPYPGVFTAANVVDCFSSDGPRRIFFTGNGTAITANNFLASGGQVLAKPDLTAADGNMVSGAGYDATKPLNQVKTPFFGTSSAAPHAAAIAALVWSKNPAQTASQVKAALLASAIGIQAAGVDRDSGIGIIMADTAVLGAALFTDDPLQAGVTPVKAVHLTELRTMLNTVLGRYGQSFSFTTDPSPTTATTIKAAHIIQLRQALVAAYAAAGVTPTPTFATATITPGTTTITAAMLTEIRNYLRTIY